MKNWQAVGGGSWGCWLLLIPSPQPGVDTDDTEVDPRPGNSLFSKR